MISFLLPRRRAALNEDSYFAPLYQRTKAGVFMNEDVALGYTTVLACTQILAEPLAGIPIRGYEQKDDDDRRQIKPNEMPEVEVVSWPNEDMTGYTFRESRTQHQINWKGGGFAELVRDKRTGRIAEMHPIHPSRVNPGKDGYAYAVTNDDGTKENFIARDMLHFCGALSHDGIWSPGLANLARQMIGGALATDYHSWAYFGSGAQPKGVLSTPGLKQREDRREFRKEWREIHGSPDSAEIAIVPKESTYMPLGSNNSDNQFAELTDMNRKRVCELYRVPIHMIGESVPGTGIEAINAKFVMDALYPWARKQEEQLAFKLFDRSQRHKYFFEFDFTSLLRGEIGVRMTAYRVGITTGVFTINHCRRLENLPGIGPAGDVNYVPANMFTADQMKDGNPSASGTPGSDHTGAPADNPLDHQPAMFDRWTRKNLRTIERNDLTAQLAAMESELSDRRTDWTEAAQIALQDVLGRMLHKEANAAQRAADAAKGGSLDAWVREFYSKHETLLADALRPACAVLRLAGVWRWSKQTELAAWLKSRSVDVLQASYNRDSKEVFARRLAAWSTERACELTEEILGRSTRSVQLESAIETLADVTNKQADLAKKQADVAQKQLDAASVPAVVHVHIPEKSDAIIKRDADGKLAGITYVPAKGSDVKPKAK